MKLFLPSALLLWTQSLQVQAHNTDAYGNPMIWGSSMDAHGTFKDSRDLQGLPPVAPEIFFLAMTNPAINGAVAEYETPIAVRYTNYVSAIWWNCVAVYSEDFKDTLTKEIPAVRVLDESLHTTSSRLVCMLQGVATYISLSLPEAKEFYMDIVGGNNPFNVTYDIEDTPDPFVAGCGDDVDCLEELAASENYNSNIMGHIVAKLAYDYSLQDGFNQLGKDDGCQVNCRAFMDVTGYKPVNDPYAKNRRRNTAERWEPLLEDNGKGFFYRQEHVAAHIGQTAKFRFLAEEERTQRVATPPNYTRRRWVESREVIDLMATLDDFKKVEVEIFDDKLNVASAAVNGFLGAVIGAQYEDPVFQNAPGTFLTLERLVNFISGFAAVEMDSNTISWKEKVNYDLVRPTSVIKQFCEDITTWAPGGIQTFPAENFEAYIRVMPHSEYVSGSACLFQGVEDYIVGYFEEIEIDTPFPVSFGPVGPGESIVEPGLVPGEGVTITLQYESIQAMAAAGSQSRLNGGMHFEASVPAAKALCDGIGTVVMTGTTDLYK